MMNERNWLIRTKSNKILGPLSKEKVIEFVQDGTLTEEDELCSGNGFWFWIKEDDLLNKYLFGAEEQTFNPVAEAETKIANKLVGLVKTKGIVETYEGGNDSTPIGMPDIPNDSITTNDNITINVTEDGEEVILPDDGDLDFPDPIDYSNTTLPEHNTVEKTSKEECEIPSNVGVSLSEAAQAMDIEEEEIILPPSEDLDFPDMDDDMPTLASVVEDNADEASIDLADLVNEEVSSDEDLIALKAKEALEAERNSEANIALDTSEEVEEDEIAPMKAVEMPRPAKKKKATKKKTSVKKKKRKSDYSFVYVALLILIILLFFISKFYTKLVGKDLFSEVSFKMPTSTVMAQEFSADKKKRYF